MSQYKGKGMVVYTDGGTHRGNPAPHGFGVHYYLYSNDKGGGNTTTHGYTGKSNVKAFPVVSSKQEFIEQCKSNKYLVKVEKADSHYQGYAESGTNNLAELKGMNYALDCLIKEEADHTLIFSDSQYVLDGIRYLPNWAKNNWKLSTGSEVKNREQWESLYNKIKTVHQKGLSWESAWIKGHGATKQGQHSKSDLPNDIADGLATKGANEGNNLKLGIVVEKPKAVVKETSKPAKKEKARLHPLLWQRRVYVGYNGRDNKELFFTGAPGDVKPDTKRGERLDDFTGKFVADATQGIVFIKGGVPVIEAIEKVQESWLVNCYKHTNQLYAIDLDTVGTSSVYEKLHNEGVESITASEGVPHLETLDGKHITYVNDPVMLALRNIDQLTYLFNVFSSYQHDANDEEFRTFDITHQFYETKSGKVNKDLQHKEKEIPIGTKLLGSIDNSAKSYKSGVTFKLPDSKHVDIDLILSVGIELPNRNVLKRIESMNPNIKLVTWHYSGTLYRYGVLITLHEEVSKDLYSVSDYSFYRGTNCSQILL